jgi:hypothetical protein
MQHHFCEIRTVRPGRLKIRTTREQHQYGSRGCLVKQEPKQFQDRWVSPVQVFQDKEDRVMFSKFQEDGDNIPHMVRD